MPRFRSKRFSTGFTLIEIIIVMAVIAVLAGITLVALNPLEQLAGANDTKTKQSVGKLGGLLTSFYAQRQVFPTADSDWISELMTTGDLNERPASPQATCGPSSANDSNFCLQTSASSAIVYAQLSSLSQDRKCPVASEVPYFAFETSKGKSCIICAAPNATIPPGETCDVAQ